MDTNMPTKATTETLATGDMANPAPGSSIIKSEPEKATKVTKQRAAHLSATRKSVLESFLDDGFAEPWKIVCFTGDSWKWELMHRFKTNAKCRYKEISLDDIDRWMKYPAYASQLKKIMTKGGEQYNNFMKIRENFANGKYSQDLSHMNESNCADILHNMSISPPSSLNFYESESMPAVSTVSFGGGVHPGIHAMVMTETYLYALRRNNAMNGKNKDQHQSTSNMEPNGRRGLFSKQPSTSSYFLNRSSTSGSSNKVLNTAAASSFSRMAYNRHVPHMSLVGRGDSVRGMVGPASKRTKISVSSLIESTKIKMGMQAAKPSGSNSSTKA